MHSRTITERMACFIATFAISQRKDALSFSEGNKSLVSCVNASGQSVEEEEEASRKHHAEMAFWEKMTDLRKDNICDPTYETVTLANDDGINQKVSNFCRKYIDRWPQMLENNIGVLFHGRSAQASHSSPARLPMNSYKSTFRPRSPAFHVS